MAITNNRAIDVLTSVAERLVMTGMYSSSDEAVEALALAQIDRDIEKYQRRIAALEAKYGMNFEEFTAYLRNRATMEEEIDWEEWDDARTMLKVRTKSREAIRGKQVHWEVVG
jgi:hypothetical protein